MDGSITRRSGIAAMAGLMTAPVLAAALAGTASADEPGTPAASPLPPVTIYHLEGRRSERVVWLMEELGLPYDLVYKRGDLLGSMALIRELSPVVPMAPTVKYAYQILVESGAIIELILARHAQGKLRPETDSLHYPAYLMWMHFAEGSMAARLFSDYRAWMANPPSKRSPMVDSEAVVQFAENFLAEHEWFGGPEFSAADIMMLFPLRVATQLNIVDADQFPNVLAWAARAEARPAYQRMLEKARPDGLIGALPPLKVHAPHGPR